MVALTEFAGTMMAKLNWTPSSVQLEEVTIRPKDALSLMSDVLDNIQNNYSASPMMMRGFYRETIVEGTKLCLHFRSGD